ncbi:hypothetical protein HDU76_009807 [Blyttiomyces sp. JEL0837]|nr:hypothetical protein HDU76_009807 [Blyttiomyces sp. JEL0837]
MSDNKTNNYIVSPGKYNGQGYTEFMVHRDKVLVFIGQNKLGHIISTAKGEEPTMPLGQRPPYKSDMEYPTKLPLVVAGIDAMPPYPAPANAPLYTASAAKTCNQEIERIFEEDIDRFKIPNSMAKADQDNWNRQRDDFVKWRNDTDTAIVVDVVLVKAGKQRRGGGEQYGNEKDSFFLQKIYQGLLNIRFWYGTHSVKYQQGLIWSSWHKTQITLFTTMSSSPDKKSWVTFDLAEETILIEITDKLIINENTSNDGIYHLATFEIKEVSKWSRNHVRKVKIEFESEEVATGFMKGWNEAMV